MKAALNIAVVFCIAATCAANESVIQYAKTRNIPTLSGTVTDTTGAAIPGVRVCTMTKDGS